MNRRYEHLLSPIRIGNFILKNRMINTQSISQELQGPQIYPDEAYQRYTTDYAKNGAAVVNLTVGSWPDANGRHGPMDQFYMEDRKVLNAFAKQIDRVHAFSSLACGSIAPQFGRFQISELRDPSRITWRGDYGGGPHFVYGGLPAVSKDQMKTAIDTAVSHARDLATMGFDCINIHMSYRSGLLAHALSPALNQREDEYGGSLENRCRLPLEFFAQLKDAIGPNKLIQCQVSGIEEQPYGYTTEDFLYFCEQASKYVDIFSIRGWDGSSSHISTFNFSEHHPATLDYAEAFKKRGIQAVCAPSGGFQNPDDIDRWIAEGRMDMVCMARAFICDSEFGKKLQQGRGEDIVPCIRCDRCHGAVCSVNPKIGLAHVMDDLFDAPGEKKKVAVIGGGPAGMKAALTAAQRGHQVTLFEAQDHLGGQLIHADYMDFKIPLRRYKEYLIRQVAKADIDVRLNARATKELIEAGGYDAVIAACGATPKKLDIPGAQQENVWAPIDVFGNEDQLGEKVVVIGGADTAAEMAIYMDRIGRNVTCVTRQSKICENFESHATRVFREMTDRVPTIPKSQVTAIDGNTLYYTDQEGAAHSIEADSFIMSAGISPNVDECEKFAGLAPQFFVIGDSDVKVCELFLIHFVGPEGLNGGKRRVFQPNVRHATYTAYTAASQI